ncbi:hypothetical protein JXB11_02705 [Candidatus Woesearchaeota archaeon]|nr:hypothetical protein [Candidatus Woesearchaeota archaeon]
MKLAIVAVLALALCYSIISCPEEKAYFCHEEGCAEIIAEELSGAEEEVVFASYTLTHPLIATELILSHHNGVEVRGIIEKNNINSRYSQYQRLLEQGVNVKHDSNSALMHHKFFVIDKKTVITGSFNPTKSADSVNDDNLIVIRDSRIAVKYANEFDRMWHGNN